MTAPIYLNALRAFEASARHQSFSAAAKELNVTPAAVGQLVRSLETTLEVSLFHRQNSGKQRLVLTELAEAVLPDIKEGLEKLSSGLEKLTTKHEDKVLTITISPAFAEKWLLPRIDQFQNICPDITFRLDINHQLVDLSAHKMDIGIRYGAGNWVGVDRVKIMDEEIYPVCSPEFLQQRTTELTLENLQNESLIIDISMKSHAEFPTWEKWFQHACRFI